MRNNPKWNIVKSVFMAAFSAIGSVWTILEIIQVCPLPASSLDTIEEYSFYILIIAAIVGGIYRLVYFIRQIIFPTFKKEDKTISVRIGNILNKTKGTIMIGVNKELITAPGKIGSSSIHMQLLNKYTSERSTIKELFQEHKAARERGDAKQDFFQHKIGKNDILFLPMSNLNGQGGATTTSGMVKQVLTDLFSTQEALHIEEHTLFCPLLGTGEAGMHLSKEDTIKMIARTFVICCGEMDSESADRIQHLKIVVHPKDCPDINWVRLSRDLEFIVDNCGACVR